ncbi:MAG TPA: extracellular solute-binding protein [Epulopiscium sp.]|nr:extracellular solute-binding protein [Candidatus Epulonipiscium sp.]
MKSKFISLATIAALSVGILSGCGAKPAPTDSTAKNEEKSPSGDVKDTSEVAEIKLKWAVWDIASTTYYQPLIDGFKAENPNVTIEMVDLGSQDYQTVLGTQLSGSDTDLDVVNIKDIPGYVNLVAKNVLEPVDTANVDLSGYGGITNQIVIDNLLYALPFRSDFWLMFYNKEIFDTAGVDYPSNDMTFEEYDTLARKVAKDELGNEIYGSHYHTWRSAVQLFGILDGKNSIVDGQYDFLKPYYDLVVAQQKDMISQDYATLKTSNLHYSGAFAQGNVAMMNMGSWFIPTLIEKIATGEYTDISDWGLAKYPHAEGVEPGSTLATITSLSVTAASKNKQEATDFMKFVCGPKGAEIIASTGTFPAIKTDAVVNAISSMEGFPQDGTSAEALKTADTYLEMPIHPRSAEIEVVLNDAHDYIMTGTKTVDEGIAYMNEEVPKVLK